MEHHSATKGTNYSRHTTWMNLRNITLSGRSQTAKRTYHMMPSALNSRTGKNNIVTEAEQGLPGAGRGGNAKEREGTRQFLYPDRAGVPWLCRFVNYLKL